MSLRDVDPFQNGDWNTYPLWYVFRVIANGFR
jgi:hypothetical protein